MQGTAEILTHERFQTEEAEALHFEQVVAPAIRNELAVATERNRCAELSKLAKQAERIGVRLDVAAMIFDRVGVDEVRGHLLWLATYQQNGDPA